MRLKIKDISSKKYGIKSYSINKNNTIKERTKYWKSIGKFKAMWDITFIKPHSILELTESTIYGIMFWDGYFITDNEIFNNLGPINDRYKSLKFRSIVYER